MARLTQWIMALAGLLTSASMSSCSRGNENEEPRPPVDTEQSVAKPVKDMIIDWSLFDALREAEKAADSNDVSKVPGAYYGVPPAYESKFKFKSTPCTSRPNTRPLIPEVTGYRARRSVQNMVRSHFREIRACFENEFERNNKMGSGRVIVSWNIDEDEEGMVSGVTIKETELHNKRIEDCLVEAISRLRFPKPRGVDSVHVEYPFFFESPTDD